MEVQYQKSEYTGCNNCKHTNVDARDYPCNECKNAIVTFDHYKPMTIADKIRSNDDMYMSVQIAGCIVSYLVQNEIVEGTEADHKELISGIADDILEWLQAEVKEGGEDE